MSDRYEGEAFAGYRRLGAVHIDFEVYHRDWFANLRSDAGIDMNAVEFIRIGDRDLRLNFQNGNANEARFKGLGPPPWKSH